MTALIRRNLVANGMQNAPECLKAVMPVFPSGLVKDVTNPLVGFLNGSIDNVHVGLRRHSNMLPGTRSSKPGDNGSIA